MAKTFKFFDYIAIISNINKNKSGLLNEVLIIENYYNAVKFIFDAIYKIV